MPYAHTAWKLHNNFVAPGMPMSPATSGGLPMATVSASSESALTVVRVLYRVMVVTMLDLNADGTSDLTQPWWVPLSWQLTIVPRISSTAAWPFAGVGPYEWNYPGGDAGHVSSYRPVPLSGVPGGYEAAIHQFNGETKGARKFEGPAEVQTAAVLGWRDSDYFLEHILGSVSIQAWIKVLYGSDTPIT